MTKQLTTQQAQYLKVILSEQINACEQAVNRSKEYITYLYDQCDKDKPEETTNAFKDMNRQKSAVRYFKDEIKKLAAIQRVVKQLAK
jgi:hypothetical protein